MMNVTIYNIKPDKIDSYFEGLRRYMEISPAFTALRGKSESGRSRSERGYQLTAASTAGQLARALGCSENKSAALSMAVGSFFPKYGREGLKAVKEYAADRGLELDPENMGTDMIEFNLDESGQIISAEFDVMLREYFSGEAETEEVSIVRFVQQVITDVKKAEAFHDGDPGKLLYDVTSEVVITAKETGKLGRGAILEGFDEQIRDYSFPPLTAAEREDVIKTLDRFVEEFSDYPQELAKYNKTPEEAVLIYIYLHD
ncbi:MAG: hypothetical protein J6M22_06210 [Firmicutes bacterium]|nr:hypothetical protein [Bacillota bacterium]